MVLVIGSCFLLPKAAAQPDRYPEMPPVDQCLMERNAEILLARSAAPDSVSNDATIFALGRQGYEAAVRKGRVRLYGGKKLDGGVCLA